MTQAIQATPIKKYSRTIIEQIKKAAGVEPYQTRLQGWEESGTEYRAYCPWHEGGGNHNPSLAVFKDKKSGDWRFDCMSKHCHSGDVIAFVMLVDDVQFHDAVRRIDEKLPFDVTASVSETVRPATAEEIARVREYLLGQGVDPKTAAEAGVKAVWHPVLGVSLEFHYDADPGIVKYRTLEKTCDPTKKFMHASGKSSAHLLYNIEAVKSTLAKEFIPPVVYVTESERDCLLLQDKGYVAVSVSSASSCVSQGPLKELKIEQDQLDAFVVLPSKTGHLI